MVQKISVGKGETAGVTWLENKIYTINRRSTTVRTFEDHEPFNEEKTIEVEDMTIPTDLVSSKVDRAIFISDIHDENPCLWRIQMPDRIIRRYEIDGLPWKLSITPSDDLLVLAERRDRYYLDIYRSSDVTQLQSILMPTEIKEMYHAVQTTNGNFFIACYDLKLSLYWVYNTGYGFAIQELSKDGTQFLGPFDLQSIDSIYPISLKSGNHLI